MNNAQGKRILVTGGTGFTGTHLVRRLLDLGHDVVVLDSQPGLFYEELLNAGAEIVLGSVTDRQLVDKLVEGAHSVFHLAAAFREVNLPKEEYWDVNVNGTRYVLESAVRHGVCRVIYCSTCGVHGHVEHPPATEDAPIRPADYYQHTKYEGEKVAHDFMGDGLGVTILRPTAIYGPGDPERWLILFKRVQPGWFLMFGDGSATYHPLYIDNLIDACLLAMEREEAVGQTYLIADKEYYTLNDLVREVGRAIDKDVTVFRLPFWPLWLLAFVTEMAFKPFQMDPPIFRRRVDWFRQTRAFSIEKASRELGYQPEIPLPIGLEKTAAWYRDQGYL